MGCVIQAQGIGQVCLGPFQLRIFCDSVPLRIYQQGPGYFTWKSLAAPISSPGLFSLPSLMDKSSQLDLVSHDQGKKHSSSQLGLRFYVDFLFLPFLHCSITCQDKEIITEPGKQGKSKKTSDLIPEEKVVEKQTPQFYSQN